MRRLLGFVTLLILIGSMTALAGPDENHPEFWGDDCFKIDESFGDVWIVDNDYRLVVAKAGQVNHEYHNVSKGDIIDPPQDISHLILCAEVLSSTTTTTTTTIIPTSILESTTTTILESTTSMVVTTEASTTTSSVPLVSTTMMETTTTVNEPTTTVRESTTSSLSPSTTLTSTTEAPTTTSTELSTTTTEPSTTTTDPPLQLPLTGANLAILLTLGGLLTTIGFLLVRKFSTQDRLPKS